MLLAGFENLSANKQQVDALNVFPVPDGDTGTNMSLTVQAAAKEVENLKDLQLKTFAQAAATGALMGARGNSGVILSQLFRGFTQVLETADKVDGVILAKAFQSASEVAYRAVIKPVEGTILTVAKAAAKGAREAAAQENNYEKVISNALQYAQKALDKTPTMLPALAQAGVVDAGGKGLCLLIEGALKSLSGEWHSTESLTSEIKELETKEKVAQSLEFRYCTELIIKGLNLSQDLTRKALEKLGDSLLVVGNANVTKIHIHTNHPGKVLEYAVTQGTLHDIKIDNMEEQHQERYLAGKDEDLEEDITAYLVRVSQEGLNPESSKFHTGLLHAANDIERIGDHAENIANITKQYIDAGLSFSEQAVDEMKTLYDLVEQSYSKTIKALQKDDQQLAREAMLIINKASQLEKQLRNSHIERLTAGTCIPASGVLFLDVLSNLKRVSDHAHNIAQVVLGEV